MFSVGLYRTSGSFVRNLIGKFFPAFCGHAPCGLDDLLRIAADSTDQGYVVLNGDLEVIWVNMGFTRMTGYEVADFVHINPLELLATSQTDSIHLQELITALRNKTSASSELYLQARGGRQFWTYCSFQLAKTGSRSVPHFIGLFRDITQQRYMLDALRESETRSRAIVETALDAVITTDHHGMIAGWNPRAEEMFGWSRREVLHQPLVVRVFPRATRTDMLDAVHAIFSGKACTINGGRFETELLRRNGELFPAELSVSSMHGKDHIFVNMFIRDVSDRRRAEEAQRKAKEVAEAANRAKSEFLANMSHEIRTPLNGVIGMAELLNKTELDEQQKRYVSLARTSADTLLTLINEVLDFSKIEAGKLELDPAPVDLAACVEDVVEMLGQRAADRNLELACQIRPEARCMVIADMHRVRQVLINLVNNAIKFTHVGHVLVRVNVAMLENNDVLFECSVEDSGIGIPADRQNRLFKSFSQVDGSSTRQYGGTGLGLAISKQLIELMNGQIGVTSQEGAGSTFWFKIPLKRARETRPAASAPHDLRGMRVLAIDDFAAHRMVLSEYLSGWGFFGDLVADGANAIKKLREANAAGMPYKLVLVDLLMPGMDGFAFAQALAELNLPDPPRLILMSATHQHMTSADLREKGFCAFVPKPYRQSQLLDAIVSVMAGAPICKKSAPKPAVKSAPEHVAQPNDIRVLLAEDNEVNRLLAQEVLRQSGFMCDSVVNGLEAVAAVQRGIYDAVLMDCQMPQLDGFGATAEIRRLESMNAPTRRGGGTMPIVALTANAIKGDREKCLAAGMNGYLTKPINARELTRTLNALLLPEQNNNAMPDAAPAPMQKSAPVSAAKAPVRPIAAMPANQDHAEETAEPAISFEELLERCMGSRELTEKVLVAFEKEALCELTHITELIRTQRTADAAKRIHSLKGSAGNIAAHELHKLATEMDRCAKQNNLAGLVDMLKPMESEVNRCVQFIRERDQITL